MEVVDQVDGVAGVWMKVVRLSKEYLLWEGTRGWCGCLWVRW